MRFICVSEFDDGHLVARYLPIFVYLDFASHGPVINRGYFHLAFAEHGLFAFASERWISS